MNGFRPFLALDETLLCGPRDIYPLAFHRKWWFHLTFLYVCAIEGHRNMNNPKRGQDITRVGSIVSKWEFLHYMSKIFMAGSPICESSAASKLDFGFYRYSIVLYPYYYPMQQGGCFWHISRNFMSNLVSVDHTLSTPSLPTIFVTPCDFYICLS